MKKQLITISMERKVTSTLIMVVWGVPSQNTSRIPARDSPNLQISTISAVTKIITLSMNNLDSLMTIIKPDTRKQQLEVEEVLSNTVPVTIIVVLVAFMKKIPLITLVKVILQITKAPIQSLITEVEVIKHVVVAIDIRVQTFS